MLFSEVPFFAYIPDGCAAEPAVLNDVLLSKLPSMGTLWDISGACVSADISGGGDESENVSHVETP